MKMLFEKWFLTRLSLTKIKKHCSRLEMKKNNPVSMNDYPGVRIACVQRQIQLCKNVEQYIDLVYGSVRRAAEDGCHLIIFPEYNFFDLLGLLPGFALADRYLNGRGRREINRINEGNEIKEGSSYSLIKFLFNAISRPVERALKSIMSNLARGFGIYIYSGSYLLKRNDTLYNAGSLFGPDGSCLGTQKKLHLTDFEAKIGMGRGIEMEVYSLPFGRTVFPICMDATYFETFHLADKLGAELVILPIANMEEYNVWRAMRGIWGRVQESYVYGLKAALNGWIAGMHFTGKAGIFAPLEMRPDKSGIISLAPRPAGDYLIVADLNMAELKKIRSNAEYYGDKNPEFEKNYIRETYRELIKSEVCLRKLG